MYCDKFLYLMFKYFFEMFKVYIDKFKVKLYNKHVIKQEINTGGQNNEADISRNTQRAPNSGLRPDVQGLHALQHTNREG